MPHFTKLSKLQRGSTLKVLISVLSTGLMEKVKTESIYVSGIVEVTFKITIGICDTFTACVSMKKISSTDSTVHVHITYDDYDEHLICVDNWLEYKMKTNAKTLKKEIDTKTFNVVFLDINITAYEEPVFVAPLSNFKLREDTKFTDFHLHAPDGKVAVHKAMLSVQSDVFNAMLKGEWKEATGCHVDVKGATVKTLQHLKDYMYLGTLPDEAELESLLLVAARYLIDELKAACIKKIIKTMQPKNFDAVVKLACQHDIRELVQALVLQIPDDVLNGIHQLKKNNKKKYGYKNQ